jgi:hypothetical protein
MPPTGFEPAIAASEQPQTFALERSATGIGFLPYLPFFIFLSPGFIITAVHFTSPQLP